MTLALDAAGVRRQRRASSVRRLLSARVAAGSAGVLTALGLWQMLSVLGALSQRYFPSAGAVLDQLLKLLSQPAFWNVLGATMQAWAIGLLLAAAIGVPAGIILGASSRAHRFFRVVIEAVRP